MSKQAWRVVLKKEQKHKGRDREREKVRETEKEEKVRGTAQESFHHEAQKTKQTILITTYNKDDAVDTSPFF